MTELTGKYTSCKIFTDYTEQSAISQVYEFLNHPAFENKKTRFMPDIHAGSGAVIGTTVELGDKVIPNTIGVDIGCGMYSVKLSTKEINYKALDRNIKQNVPSGFNMNNKQQAIPKLLERDIVSTCKEIGIETHRALFSLGSLGGGNHFIEIGRDEQNFLWLTIHSGSRNFGLQIAKYHQKIAEQNYSNPKPDLTNVSPKEREAYIRKFKETRVKIPKGMEYLTGADKEAYELHMRIAQRYASESRKIMVRNILKTLDCAVLEEIESIHNYIDFEHGIIRKGAISAQKDELVIIPWNMRDGLIIGRGLGNPDWNFSAPHGAGRTMSRSQAKKEVNLDEFKASMEGIYSSCVSESTLDESPMAYKDHTEVEKYLEESVEILHRVKPEYNFKA
jgi:RNA-splicing ligase RtcB